MVRAMVKGSLLECYEWEHEDRLFITEKLSVLDEKYCVYLLQAFNIDKMECGAVTNDQVLFVDNPYDILDSEPIFNDSFKAIAGCGAFYIGLKEKWDNAKDNA